MNLPLQLLEGGLIAREPVGVVELVGERPDQRFEIARQRPDLLDAGVERLGQFVDALRERVEAGRAGALRDVVDARAERLHVAGKRGDAFGRCDAGGELAQLVDRGFEVAQHLRDRASRPPRLSILCDELGHRARRTRKAFGRRHRVERAAWTSSRLRSMPRARTDRRRGHSRDRSRSASACTSPAGFRACGAAAPRGWRVAMSARSARSAAIASSTPDGRRSDSICAVMWMKLPFEAGEIRSRPQAPARRRPG